MSEFKKYARIQRTSELRNYIPGEDLSGISVSDGDAPGSDRDDKIARNPADHSDKWFIAGAYFRGNFELNPVEDV